jgi:hypothetical protein
MLRFAFALVLLACGDPVDPGRDGSLPNVPTRIESYVRADAARRLVIELDYVDGALPRASVEADLIARLSSLLDKPDGIEVVHDDVITSRGADHAWTDAELFELADETFDDGAPGAISMHVMWVDGHAADDSGSSATLGLAWSNTHIAMYHDTIEANCSPGPLLREEVCSAAQLLVWLHEVGHVIGLVDNGLPMVEAHRDPDHGAHDVNEDCIMYWAFEGREGLDVLRDRILGGGEMQDFDAQCLADVAALRDP